MILFNEYIMVGFSSGDSYNCINPIVSSLLRTGLASVSPRRLHVLVVDPAVGVDVVAKVDLIGDFAQVSLDVADIAVPDVSVAIHVADQEAAAGLGGGQGVTQSVMHVGEGEGYLLLVAGLTVERHQERVGIIWINAQAPNCSAARACAV